jgi:L-lactate permease
MSILYTVNKIKIVEAFSTTQNSPTIIENNNVKVLDAFNKYLLHTLYISLLLKSYKHYNVTNDSINKEFNYYNKQEIKQKHINSKIVDSNAVYYLDNKIYEYRSYMLHIITVIITSSVLLSSYTCNKRTVDTIMWSAVMLIVLVIFIYIMNVNNLVRTEPRKLYWYPPKF